MAHIIEAPSTLDGALLVSELNAAGIEVGEFGVRDEGDGSIWVGTDAPLDDVLAVVQAHNPPQPVPPTPLEKLESVGLTVEDLRTLLGL